MCKLDGNHFQRRATTTAEVLKCNKVTIPLVFAELMYREKKLQTWEILAKLDKATHSPIPNWSAESTAERKRETARKRERMEHAGSRASIVNPHYRHNYYAKNIMRSGSLPEYSRDRPSVRQTNFNAHE